MTPDQEATMPEPQAMTLAEAMLHLGKANRWLERHESGVWAVYKFDAIFDQIDTTATGATWPEVVSVVLNRKVVERDVTAELRDAAKDWLEARHAHQLKDLTPRNSHSIEGKVDARFRLSRAEGELVGILRSLVGEGEA